MSLTAAGLTIPTAPEVLARLQASIDAELVAAGAPPCDWGADLALSQVVAPVALELHALYELAQAVYDVGDPDTAEGIAQDSISALVGVKRLPAVPSTVTLLLVGTPGTVIPAGKEAQGGGTDGLARWRLLEAATIDAGGRTTAVAECTVTGPTVAQPGAIASIATPVSGWDSVTHSSAARLGRARERDEQLKLRRAQALQLGASRSVEAVRSRLLTLGFLTGCAVIENQAASTALVQGLTLPPNCMAAVVYPPTLSDAQKASVAQVLFNLGPEGIRIYGEDEQIEVTKSDGFAMEVGFTYATDLPITVQVEGWIRTGYAWSVIKAAIQAATIDYISLLGLGAPAELLALTRVLGEIEGLRRVVIRLNGGFTDIQPAVTQILVFEPVGSSVVQGV